MKITQSVFIFMIKIYVVVTILALVVWVALLINNHIFHTTEVYGTISSDNPTPNEYAIKIENKTFYLSEAELGNIELIGFYVEDGLCKPYSAYAKMQIPADSMVYIFKNGFIYKCGEIKSIPKYIFQENR
ncbi:hypothetical protein LS66_003000 [Helicobacter sp. MIT 03-1614]|uniref:hypothetical protein n=1 Tax=Helicobacter sp. MIT 03-1614 TaxID=1548147 RepID=UPI0005134BFD|nr:hypothetical protein [Helicobacter sp. MIT 03-1614]TLD90451.1 hypothetical protein LS66_003000 [Helicobacter sp. MIT 03-1614]